MCGRERPHCVTACMPTSSWCESQSTAETKCHLSFRSWLLCRGEQLRRDQESITGFTGQRTTLEA